MNVWVALVVGLLAGWLVEFLIDYFYWRPRRLCPDDTAQAMRGQVGRLEAEKATAQLTLEAQQTQLRELRAAVGAREAELATAKSDLAARAGEAASWQARFGQLEASLQTRQGELANVQAHNQALTAELETRRTEIATLRGQLEDVDSGFKGLGIGALAGGALGGLGARFVALRDRLTGHEDEAGRLKAQLERQSAELTAAQAAIGAHEQRLGDLSAELNAREAEAARLRSELTASSSAATAAQARLSACEAEVSARTAEVESLRGHILALQSEAAAREAELAAAQSQLGALEVELAACQEQARAWQTGATLGVGGAAAALALGVAADRAEAEPAMAEPVVEEFGMPALDAGSVETAVGAPETGELAGASGLSMVWGLNTQANQVLAQQGITSYEKLAASTPVQVDQALGLAQAYYPGQEKAAIHGQWVQQSRLAAAGDWDGLATYQAAYDRKALRDDLKLLWGIGPKIEQVLNDNGIYLFAQLASAPAERVTEILRRAGSRFRMSGAKLHVTWPEQARLADAGEWEALQKLTDQLSWSAAH